jgi:hypothetical protein
MLVYQRVNGYLPSPFNGLITMEKPNFWRVHDNDNDIMLIVDDSWRFPFCHGGIPLVD